MSYGFKLLAHKLVAPTGTPQTLLAPPGNGVVISRITITPTWESATSQGYIPKHSGGAGNLVELHKEGKPYDGYNRNGGGLLKYRYNDRDKPPGVLLSNTPSQNRPHRMCIKADTQGFAHVGAYSMFTLGINGTVFTGVLDAPLITAPLDMQGPISLGPGQTLQITNGVVPFPGHTIQENYELLHDNTPGKMTIETAINDHRARASHLRVIAYGQEIP